MADSIQTTVSDISTAFASGSGISASSMTAVAFVTVIALIAVLGISVLFKKLQGFQKDDNAHEVLRTTGIIFLAIILVIIIANGLIIRP